MEASVKAGVGFGKEFDSATVSFVKAPNRVQNDLGISRYGSSQLHETIAEAHASFMLGRTKPIVLELAKAYKWTR